jgi:hypothetical protein
MKREMAAYGRVIPVHGRVVCGEHGTRVGNERVMFRIDDPVVGNASLFESGKH